MHRVVVEIDDSSKPALRSEGDRDHAIKLVQMLAVKMDSISRTELFKRHAAEHGMRNYLELFEQTEKRDRAHITWLKEQIRQSIR